MEVETSQNGTVPFPKQNKNREWLIEMMNEQEERSIKITNEQAEQPTRPKTRIQKVDKTLLQIGSNNTCFYPLVVSLGPYHHGKEHLLPMERYKNVAARWFISLVMNKRASTITEMVDQANGVYDKFIEKAPSVSSLIESYDAAEFLPTFEAEDFMRMMFLDGCFILHFIHLALYGRSGEVLESSHLLNQPLIVRDMFLLENQIPYPILNALMSLLPDQEIPKAWIMEFIFTFFLPPFEFNFSAIGFWRVLVLIFELFLLPIRGYIFLGIWKSIYGVGIEPLHLLDLLRAVFVGDGSSPLSSCVRRYRDYDLRPIRELKAVGIQVSKGSSWLLKEVKFKKDLVNSRLELPQIIVDDSTKTRLLNLVAYEMCPNGPLEHTATSYICFLHSLIHKTEDVKELQSENILLNHLDSNEEVVNLFKELATYLSPDYNAYNDVVNGIKDHYKRHFNRERVRIGEWVDQCKRTYFTSPWTIISLIAAIFLLLLTLLQTIYTIWGFYKAN